MTEFTMDYDKLAQVVAALLFLAFVVERSLAIVFEHPLYERIHGKGLKPVLCIVVAFIICKSVGFDMLAATFHQEEVSKFGYLMTSMVIAGGTKGVMKFTHDVLKIPNYTDQVAMKATGRTSGK